MTRTVIDQEEDTASSHRPEQRFDDSRHQRRLRRTRLGPWKNWRRLLLFEKVFLIAWYVAVTINIALTVANYITSSTKGETTTYKVIFVVASGFNLLYATMGVFQERAPELIALCISNAIMLGYVIIDFIDAGEKSTTPKLKLVYLVFTSVFTAVFLPWSIYLAYHYWTHKALITFAVCSVNNELRNKAEFLFMFLSSITFDLQLQINFLILALKKGIERSTDIIFFATAIPITSIWALIGSIAARKDSTLILVLFVVFSLANLFYTLHAFNTIVSKRLSAEVSHLTLLSGGSAIIMRCIVLILTGFLSRNFGEGLGILIFGEKLPTRGGE